MSEPHPKEFQIQGKTEEDIELNIGISVYDGYDIMCCAKFLDGNLHTVHRYMKSKNPSPWINIIQCLRITSTCLSLSSAPK